MLRRVERLKKSSMKMKCVTARPDPIMFQVRYKAILLVKDIAEYIGLYTLQ
jgi:hypothetical protein